MPTAPSPSLDLFRAAIPRVGTSHDDQHNKHDQTPRRSTSQQNVRMLHEEEPGAALPRLPRRQQHRPGERFRLDEGEAHLFRPSLPLLLLYEAKAVGGRVACGARS